MKKKVIAIALASAFTFGGVATASTAYYLDIFNGFKKTTEAKVDSEFNTRFKEVDKQIYNDTVTMAGTEAQRLESESLEYLDQKLKAYQSNRMNANAEAIKQEADQAIIDMKAHIDSLFVK